ncbi:MAG: hypothetical protein HQ515_07485 [Phycisphaeraceae bacterium]|nr:hypothetical protein [Phycisphaeraceae bacterium]
MGDGAHAGPTTHDVFNTPLKVDPQIESWKTPDNYLGRRLPSEPELPKDMKVWRIQNSGKSYGGVVSRAYGFEDSPDAEALVLGFNTGKEYRAVGIGRHGNVLQWGYASPPSKMTDAGRKLFVNCICYISKFKDVQPLVRQTGYPRENALRLAALINQIKDPNFFKNTFPAELQSKYKGKPDGLVQYYLDDYDLIYRPRAKDGSSPFAIDKDIKALGLDSNRSIATLEKLIGLLNDREHADAARQLLARYTNQSERSQDQWQQWFIKNKDRIYFTDFGGYKFLVAPEGYPVVKP